MNSKKGFSGADQRGQVLIETLLLAIVALGLLSATLSYLKENKTLDKVVNVAWLGVAEMAEYGTWPSAGSRACDNNPRGQGACHPNGAERVRTLDPDSL